MSLSRILNNDESSPPRSIRLLQTAPLALQQQAEVSALSPISTSGGLSPHPQRHGPPDTRGGLPSPIRGYAYQPPYQGPSWDHHKGDWARGDAVSPPSHAHYHDPRSSRFMSPQDSRGRQSDILVAPYGTDTVGDSTPRKRRRDVDDDRDYQPPGLRRHGLSQKHPSKSKQPPILTSILCQFPNPDVPSGNRGGPTEEERRLASSDLEDCEEVWIGEISEYMLETQKRQNQVEKWFEASIMERNAIAAQGLSHFYSSRIARLPLPPPSPPPLSRHLSDDRLHAMSSTMEHSGSYTNVQQFGHGVDDAILGVPPNPFTSIRGKKRPKEDNKRQTSVPVSDASNEMEILNILKDSIGPATKKRRLDATAPETMNEPELLTGFEPSMGARIIALSKGKERAKPPLQRELSQDSLTLTPRGRKKPALKKRLGLDTLDHLGLASVSVSASGDATPNLSRPASPVPTVSAIIYELGEAIPPLKKAKKIDDSSMLKRVKALEEAQRKVWTNIARRDVAKVYKYHAMGYQARQSQLERIAKLASMQARKPFVKTAKANKDLQAKAKRLMREMQVFWKKNEREERDVRKREQKEAIDRAKIEEEKREAARQARKLEFLISQTELYSHFVGNKLKTTEGEGDDDKSMVPIGAELGTVDPTTLRDIDFDDEDETNLRRHARYNAEEAITLAKERAEHFDTQAALERKTNEALKLAKAQAQFRDDAAGPSAGPPRGPLVDLDSNELNFQNPSSLSGPLTISQPRMLMAQLKEYQLKGLNWLATLYEQGINGILADEMGLGKTVQSISLLAYLAETHDIWGPFLVVAPASTLHNWQQELTRFVPRLKALPYWGNVKDRTTLRKFWSKKEISYNQDAPFHVLITSYQLVTQDQQYFQRVKWQYMILDEAQNIKNSSSVRWKTLLGFHCRNRLLLTGTPIQNSMQELWALLHFIMPSLFDSHDEFNEWFSKDIENAAENKGSKLNEHQLRRLHMILKPFMLRRVKRHVQNELSEKIEKDIYVDLSARQRALYKALLANVSVADLLEKAANIGDVDSARSLMNLVMQFRKVCNHPELFERADVVAPFSFCHYGRSGPIGRETDFISLPYSARNPIEYTIPQLVYHDGGILTVPNEHSTTPSSSCYLSKLMNIWSTDWIHRSLYHDERGSFSFLRIAGVSAQDAHQLHVRPLIRSRLLAALEEARFEEKSYSLDPIFAAHSTIGSCNLSIIPRLLYLDGADNLPKLLSISLSAWAESCLSRPGLKWFIPPAIAPPISLYCTDRTLLESQARLIEAPLESLMLYGLPPQLHDSADACRSYQNMVPGLPVSGLFGHSSNDQLPSSYMQVPEAKRLIYDSAKLARLDALLQELKAGEHRVLIYFQMTRMMDLMEEYLIYRQYKYLRLDGSSKLEDRRDMVIDWQTRPDIFIFLLSTRAGGLGINLTAADTVIFYDHDWNPSNDAQAMDRAHRLGQTRQVTVYRLITKGTIDERIVQLARVKKDVQDIVVGNKNFTDVTKPSEIVQLLLNDEQLANLDAGLSAKQAGKQPDKSVGGADGPVRDLWNEEGDDFFGHTGPLAGTGPGTSDTIEDEISTPTPTTARGKRRKTGTSNRGRRLGGRKSGSTTGQATPVGDLGS